MIKNGDIPELIRLRFDFFASDPSLTVTDTQEKHIRKQLPGYYENHLNRDLFAALADENGKTAAVSFLVIHEKPANVSFPTGKTGLILNVFTYPEYRLRGLATGTLRL